MTLTDDPLIRKCQITADAAAGALNWFADAENHETLSGMQHQLQREFRRYSTQAKTLVNAVDRPMCVGLFGPSQAGKSYLAAGLSRNGSNALKVKFTGEEDKNFLNQINPEGDRESTGVVTRFSLNDVPHPDGFPVALRLLSEADLIKILGNSYFLDSDPKVLSPMSAENLAATLAKARASAAGANAVFGTEQVWDLQDYFQQQFGHLSPMTALSDYWAEAEELAPKLDIAGRAILFSPLWGAHDRLTDTFTTLVQALEKLNFAADAFARIDALIPRAASIIDVETLLGLDNPDASKLALRTMQGAPVELPRPVVTALIAELRLVITEKPWPMFEHTDLLDFPGARNRDPVDLKEFLQKDEALKELLVRGKVAYLFDRYVADQELTSMLLCVKPSNQDITSLPGLVSEWIERTHGATPENRAGRPILLYFILGWFNDHLRNKPGEDEDDLGARFKSRMNASLGNFFGKSHKWPSNWANDKPFQNCFWLRDPGYSTETFENVDGLEVGIAVAQVDRIGRMRQAYLEVDEVHEHFADPTDAWDKAMLLNDGGVSHLANSLQPVCEPEMKRKQVTARIDDLRKQMVTKLQNFHVSDDVDKRIAERRKVADDLLISIEDAGLSRKFGLLLKGMQVDEGYLQDHLYRFSRRPAVRAVNTAPAENAAPTPARKASSRFRRDTPLAQAEGTAPAAPIVKAKDKITLICDEMVVAWLTLINERADNQRFARDLGIPVDHLKELVAELTGAATRLDLTDQLAKELRRFSFPEGTDRMTQRSAVIGARKIGNFVATLGFGAVPEDKRPTAPDANGQDMPVFKSRPFVSSQINLPVEPALPEESFLGDWGYAFMALVDDNASSSKGQKVNRKQNNALGMIINQLEQTTGVPHGD